MEKNKYSVLIIDDHPIISEAYKTAFNYYKRKNKNLTFVIEEARDCDCGLKLIDLFSSEEKTLDIVFLDIKLPPSKDGKTLSGEDLGLKIKYLFPNVKIIISTSLNDNYRVHALFRNLNPDGFLIKNDITSTLLLKVIDAILKDPPFYSQTVIKLLRKQISNDLLLDEVDRRLLYEISIGTLMKDLPDLLNLSLTGVERRKRHMKNIFNIEGETDKKLIIVARNKGFI